MILDTYTSIILNAVFTGIGVAIGQPIGQILWKKYIHKNVKKVHKVIDKGLIIKVGGKNG